MPTGRPDYWYGTALYFEDNPADGETARGPTSNWAYEHKADVDAHHLMPENAQQVSIGENLGTNQDRNFLFWASTGAGAVALIVRKAGSNGEWQFIHYGTGDIVFSPGSPDEISFLNAGGVAGIWDDTPTNGELTKGLTSDWGFDHKGDAAAHHAKYLDSAAVTAVKAIVDDAPVDNETDIPISSNWAYDHKADGSAHHAQSVVFVDRGDIGSFDRGVGDFVKDGTWRDWDLSSIVGAGSRVVLLKLQFDNNTVGENINFRENGNSNAVNIADSRVQLVSNQVMDERTVQTDANGVIEYNISNGGTWAVLYVTVRGWWKV